MSDERLKYVGPNPKVLPSPKSRGTKFSAIPVGFLIIVALPTFLASFYYLLLATPVYVSEARFLVRSANQGQPTSLGVALQGVGLSSAQTDSFAVHEFIASRDGLQMLKQRFDLAGILGPPGADFLSRYPRPFEKRSDENLYKAMKRFVTVGYDSTTGISTLRVKAYSSQEARSLTEAMLVGGEDLVNRLNERASTNAVIEATTARDMARARVQAAQAELTAFRSSEAFIDPTVSARESLELIGTLRATVAMLSAERSQLVASAPSSPQLSILDSRIAAFNRQIETERSEVSGASNSLAPKVGVYEDLIKTRELADKELAAASAALVGADQEARRQRLYLDRVVNPNLPDTAIEPRRLRGILTIFFSALLAYGVGWLIYAGVREHRQA
jgi:BexC/CtrB/KpsE family polysaccharide export inner-membrane protein